MGNVKLDQEWVQLIIEARKVGIPKEEISIFLKEKGISEQLVETNNRETRIYE